MSLTFTHLTLPAFGPEEDYAPARDEAPTIYDLLAAKYPGVIENNKIATPPSGPDSGGYAYEGLDVMNPAYYIDSPEDAPAPAEADTGETEPDGEQDSALADTHEQEAVPDEEAWYPAPMEDTRLMDAVPEAAPVGDLRVRPRVTIPVIDQQLSDRVKALS